MRLLLVMLWFLKRRKIESGESCNALAWIRHFYSIPQNMPDVKGFFEGGWVVEKGGIYGL
jgi:hypothetical protein